MPRIHQNEQGNALSPITNTANHVHNIMSGSQVVVQGAGKVEIPHGSTVYESYYSQVESSSRPTEKEVTETNNLTKSGLKQPVLDAPYQLVTGSVYLYTEGVGVHDFLVQALGVGFEAQRAWFTASVASLRETLKNPANPTATKFLGWKPSGVPSGSESSVVTGAGWISIEVKDKAVEVTRVDWLSLIAVETLEV
jgi:hypothetical protein